MSESYIPNTNDSILSIMLQELKDNPGDKRSIAELAYDFNLSQRTLMRRCQQELGMTLKEWQQRMKVVKALELLQNKQSVESVALELGYATSSAFISMFHRLMGTSPRQYMDNISMGKKPNIYNYMIDLYILISLLGVVIFLLR